LVHWSVVVASCLNLVLIAILIHCLHHILCHRYHCPLHSGYNSSVSSHHCRHFTL